MAIKLADAFVAITGDSTGLDKELNKQKHNINGWLSNIGQGIAQGIGQALFQSVIGTFRAVRNEIDKSIKFASDLEEAVNKTNVAFADSAKMILEWSETSAEAFGQSQRQALEAASTFGLLFRTMGLTTEESARMSMTLVELASDMASINNITVDEAMLKIRSGLVGETEPLRTVGVLLNAVAVEAKAVEMGLAGSTEEISEQDKVMARYQLILEQTTLTQGDFARTSDELANAQRTLSAQTEDASTQLGRFFLPIQLAFTKGMSVLIAKVLPWGMQIMDSFATGLAHGIRAILPVLAQVRALFSYWLKPGSPPRLLPELTMWAKQTAEEYLHGWTLADFDAIRAMGSTIESIMRSFVGSGETSQEDLVSRIFGTSRGIHEAVREFRILGHVGEDTLLRIADAAGPAGHGIASVVRQYFELEKATMQVTKAQDALNAKSDHYAELLRPVNEELDGIRTRQRQIRQQEELKELGDLLSDPRGTTTEKELARLRVQEIQAEDRLTGLEKERDAELDKAQVRLTAAQKQQEVQRTLFAIAQASLEQQTKNNALLGEEIALRKQIAAEVAAVETKRLAELEAQEREHAATVENIADAYLRWRLATTDEVGQLAILKEQLALTQEGSAEHFDLLSDIFALEERIAATREKGGGGDGDLLIPGTDDPEAILETSQGITDLAAALDEAFAVIAGGEGRTVELAPAWQSFADTLENIGKFAQATAGYVQYFIDILFGKNPESPIAEGEDPFAGNFWLAGFVPFIGGVAEFVKALVAGDGIWTVSWRTFKEIVSGVLTQVDPEADPTTYGFYAFLNNKLIPAVDLIIAGQGVWKTVWDTFNTIVDETLASVDPEADPTTYGFYAFLNNKLIPAVDLIVAGQGVWKTLWDTFNTIVDETLASVDPEQEPTKYGAFAFLKENVIPAVNALRDGDWKTAWDSLGGTAIDSFVDGFERAALGSARFQAWAELSLAVGTGDTAGVFKALGKLFTGGVAPGLPPTHPEAPGERGGGTLLPGTEEGWKKLFKDALRDALPSLRQGTPFFIQPQPQSFSPPSIAPPPLALGGVGASTIDSNNVTLQVVQYIGPGEDTGGAAVAAERGMNSIRDYIINQRVNG